MTLHDQDRSERLRQAIAKKRALHTPTSGPSSRPPDVPSHLGDVQHGLWLAHQLDPGSAAYTLASAFRVTGQLDVHTLHRAFDLVVSRHRLLRSTFHSDGGAVLQIVHPPAPACFEVLRATDADGVTAATAAAQRPFDLETGPLVRLHVVDLPAAHDRVLLLTLHHLLGDEASLRVLWRELADAYGGGLIGQAPELQYDDYVHWLQSRGPGERQADLEYWRRRLDPLPQDLRLPFERAEHAGAARRGHLLRRQAGTVNVGGIRRLAATTGTTPFAVCAFAFRLLLHRYTGGQPVAFATPVSTRSHPSTAEMIGYFLNPVVVATPIDESLQAGEALRAFDRHLREAMSHASVPLQGIVEALSPPRHRDRQPLAQAMFVYQEPGPPPVLGAARVEPVVLDLGASKFDLTIFATLAGDALDVAVEYRGDRFDAEWMARALGHYETLLDALQAHAADGVASLPMLPVSEQSSLLAFSCGPALARDAARPLTGDILGHVSTAPHALAATCGGTRLTYAALADYARAIAGTLVGSGVAPGDRVAVFLDRSVAMVAAIVGTHAAGAAYVPLDPAYPAARNCDVLADARVAAVLTTSALRERLPQGPWRVVEVDHVGVRDTERGAQVEGRTASVHASTPADPAYVLYTSGSTGRPKGVVVSHGNLAASTRARLQVYEDTPERFLLVPSVAFDSSVAGIFWTLVAGGTLVVPTDQDAGDPRRLAHLVEAERVTTLLCVPSLWGQMLAAAPDRLQHVRGVIVAGESCSSQLVAEHLRILPGVRLWNEYGPTEATVWATVHEITAQDATRPVAIGRPIPGVRIDVLDDLGRPVPPGIPGQAWIAGPTVAQGYWGRAEETADRFVTDPGGRETRYRTGDRVAWAADGRLLFLGRADEQIKLRGFRIEPGEVEARLLEHPAVAEAAVVAHATGGAAAAAQLVAFVRASGSVEGWRDHLASRLPAHMIPSRLVPLPELPHLPNGKVDRQRLRELALTPEASGAGSHAVPSEREQALLSLWEGLLGRSGLTVTDNFFELGGHSMLVVEMVLALERDFGVTLAPADVFEVPTVRDLARRIDDRRPARAPVYRHLVPIQTMGRGAPFVVASPDFFAGIFAAHFRGHRPVYALRGVSMRAEGNYRRWRTMRHLAEELVKEIERRFAGERCTLAGYSFGASMAVEAARVLEERGTPAERLYLIAPMALDQYWFGPFRVQIDALREPVHALSRAEALRRYARHNNPLTRRPYARAKRRLVIQPWRRVLSVMGRLRAWAGLPLTPGLLFADLRVERFRLHGTYRPGPVHTPTVIFNAADTETDAAATWRPHFQGPLSIVDTPDPHVEALIPAARDVILRHMRELGD